MVLDNLSFYPQHYCKLQNPLQLTVDDTISQAQFDQLCQALAQWKTPLMISGKYLESTNSWSYYLLMPSFSLALREADDHFTCPIFWGFDQGQNPHYHNPRLPVFLVEAPQGIHLIYHDQLYINWEPAEETQAFDGETYSRLTDRMHSFFRNENGTFRSQRVSDTMQTQVLDAFLQETQSDPQQELYQAVARELYLGMTPAQYLYDYFHDFSVKGYQQADPQLAQYLLDRIADHDPPGQMQMEALVKGALTQDLLLVSAPADADKNNLILDWTKYYLQQGKKVLILSKEDASVDDILERLPEEHEILRPGLEDQIQERCLPFLPARKIQAMRYRCATNTQQLEEQILQDRQRIDNYVAALTRLQSLLTQLSDLGVALRSASQYMTTLTVQIQQRHQEMQQAQEEAERYHSHSQRYVIFLEESLHKNILTRALQKGLRRRAQEKVHLWHATVTESNRILQQATQQYTQAVEELKQLLAKIRSSGLLHHITQTQDQIRHLREQILVGKNGEPALAPSFESELRYSELLRMHCNPQPQDLHDPDYIKKEIVYMTRVRETTDKILSATRHWAAAARKEGGDGIFAEILPQACQVLGTTCPEIPEEFRFDVAIVNDADSFALHHHLVAMSKAPKALLVGDHQQEDTFFGRLFRAMYQQEADYWMANPHLWLQNARLPEDPDEAYLMQAELVDSKLQTPQAIPYVGPQAAYTSQQMEEMICNITGDGKKIVDLRLPPYIPDPDIQPPEEESLPEAEEVLTEEPDVAESDPESPKEVETDAT